VASLADLHATNAVAGDSNPRPLPKKCISPRLAVVSDQGSVSRVDLVGLLVPVAFVLWHGSTGFGRGGEAMIGSVESLVGGRGRWYRSWVRWLVSRWSALRVLLQMLAATAMLSQREGIALMIGGVAMLLEMVQDRHSICGEDRRGCHECQW
jgi:hypothetical protein